MKKVVKKVVKPAKVMVSDKKKAITAAMDKAAKNLIGKVVHYYDKIGVAIVDLKSPMRVGDTVQLMRGDQVVTQRVSSLQIEHQPVMQAKSGDIVGLKVDKEVSEGTIVLPL